MTQTQEIFVAIGRRLGSRLRRGFWRSAEASLRASAIAGLLGVGALLTVGVPSAMAAAPTATINSNPTAGYTAVQISGEIDPGSQNVQFYAEYRPAGSAEAWTEVLVEEIESGGGPTPVSEEIQNLATGTEYEVRIDAYVPGEGLFLSAEPNPTFTTKAAVPPTVVINPVTDVTASTAKFFGRINANAPGALPGDLKTRWRFVCTPSCENGVIEGEFDADGLSHEVSAEAGGLQPSQSYEVRLLVIQSVGGTAEAGPEAFSTEDTSPTIIDAGTKSVGITTATVRADINPSRLSTTYHVEYGPTEAYGSRTAESSSIGDDYQPHEVTSVIGSLQANATYHFRVSATNSAGTTEGPDHVFTTFAEPAAIETGCPNESLRYGFGALLPDCRAYEQVSPIDKDGGNALQQIRIVQASETGDALTFYNPAGLPGGVGAQDYPIFLATRTAEGWSSQGIYPPAAVGTYATVLGWSSDLRISLSAAGFPQRSSGLFARSTSGPLNVEEVVAAEANPGEEAHYALTAVSADDNLVEFESNRALTAGAVRGRPNVYLFNRGERALTLASVLNDGSSPANGAFAGSYLWFSNGGTEAGGGFYRYYTESTFSSDGRILVFTASNSGNLYIRRNPSQPQSSLNNEGVCVEPTKACTIQINASHKTNGSGPGGADPFGAQPAAFLGASKDGRYVFFASKEELTNDANTGSADQGRDLYRFDTQTGQLIDVAPDSVDPNGTEFIGFVGASEDGTKIYFAANGKLANGAIAGNCGNLSVDERHCSLYVSDHGTVSFIAPTKTGGTGAGYDNANWQPALGDANPQRISRVSADGDAVLFGSTLKLTSFANAGELEFYRYEIGKSLLCVSCSRNGTETNGASLAIRGSAIAPVPGPAPIITRNLSASGEQVFFQTADALVARDQNHLTDVYEWEEAGAGSCPVGEARGCIYLLSSGQSGQPSYLGDASADGQDVFIFTYDRLVNQDQDQLMDAYDVRVDGGSASQASFATPPCSGEACRGATQAVPALDTAGSSSFEGPQSQIHKKHIHKKHKHKKHKHKRSKKHQNNRNAKSTGGASSSSGSLDRGVRGEK